MDLMFEYYCFYLTLFLCSLFYLFCKCTCTVTLKFYKLLTVHCAACQIFSSVPTDVKVKSFSHAMSASFDDCVSPEVSLPISSEVLQELVMNVFSLNKRRQKYFSETIIPQQVPLAREPQRV